MINICFNKIKIGALTSKPFSFSSRSWELTSINTLDILDSFCSNIRVDLRDGNIMRILPFLNENLNEDWISDRIRFSYDGLINLRLHFPQFFYNNKFINISWNEVFHLLFYLLKSIDLSTFISKLNYNFFLGSFLELSNIYSIKTFTYSLNSNTSILNTVTFIDFRSFFFSTISLKTIKQKKLFVLVNLNLRMELPLLNLKIRRQILNYKLLVYYLGLAVNLNYFYEYIGNSILNLILILKGQSWLSFKLFSLNFLILINGYLTKNSNNLSLFLFNILKFVYVYFGKTYLKFLFLDVSSLNLSELGFINNINKVHSKEETSLNANLKNFNLNFFYNSLNLATSVLLSDNTKIITNSFSIYQGAHITDDSMVSDIILPSYTFFEKFGFFLNFSGLLQQSIRCFNFFSLSRSDFLICFIYNTFLIKNTKLTLKLFKIFVNIFFFKVNTSLSLIIMNNSLIKNWVKYCKVSPGLSNIFLENTLFNFQLNDFYQTNIISLNSSSTFLNSLTKKDNFN